MYKCYKVMVHIGNGVNNQHVRPMVRSFNEYQIDKLKQFIEALDQSTLHYDIQVISTTWTADLKSALEMK